MRPNRGRSGQENWLRRMVRTGGQGIDRRRKSRSPRIVGRYAGFIVLERRISRMDAKMILLSVFIALVVAESVAHSIAIANEPI